MKKLVFILACAFTLSTQAQTIQGIVIDADGESLTGANIVITNKNTQTITNQNGNFLIDIGDTGKINIKISFIGYKTFKKEIFLQKNLDLGKIILEPINFKTDEIVVTATKTSREINSVPASIEYISNKDIETLAIQKIDESMKFLPGIDIDRPFGIFGKSVVGIRGIVSSEPGRQLTLIDGIPINKSDGGGTNWNRIINSDIDHIEILKGPGASIYGNNAMGGTINLITKRPYKKGISGLAKINYGTYNSFGGEFNFMQKFNQNIKGLYYTTAGKYLKSDGYITVPDSIRNETDTAVFLTEQALNTKIGYKFSYNSFIEFEYNYYNDHRGQGTKIRLDDGATADYDTHFGKMQYKTKIGKFKINLNTFYQLEKYLRTIEKLKKSYYTLINVNSNRCDYGVITNTNTMFVNHNISFGSDFRIGSVYGIDNYQTSTDKVINKGKINNFNFYLQDEFALSDKIIIIANVNYAISMFYDGEFTIENSTQATNFMLNYAKKLDSKQWNRFSPRLSIQYNFNKKTNIYSVVSQGYRTASLDDLTRTGFINIGYKKANPQLKPETVNNIEIGSRYNHNKFSSTISCYYSQGSDFMYYVATGETIFGGRKKVYEKQNVSNVEIYGFELSGTFLILKNLKILSNFTYNNSFIKDFPDRSDLIGKRLAYTNRNTFNFSTIYSNKFILSSINFKYKDLFYLDEANEIPVKNIFDFDVKASYLFGKGFSIGLNIKNILNNQYMVNSDQISLGRFINVEFIYKFK